MSETDDQFLYLPPKWLPFFTLYRERQKLEPGMANASLAAGWWGESPSVTQDTGPGKLISHCTTLKVEIENLINVIPEGLSMSFPGQTQKREHRMKIPHREAAELAAWPIRSLGMPITGQIRHLGVR